MGWIKLERLTRLPKLIALGFFAVLAVVAASSVASAQQGTGLRVSPPRFEIQGDPGQVIAQEIVVSNQGQSPLPITMTAAGFGAAGTTGNPQLDETITTGVVAWTSISPKNFVLPAGESQTVTYIIEIPENAPPGGHYLTILAAISSGSSEGGTGITVGQRVGSLVLLSVSGDVVEKLEVSQFSAPSLAAKGPIDLSLLVKNSGNVHLRPIGKITIKSMLGGDPVELIIEPQNVLPNSEREFKATWDVGWKIGRYTAEYSALYGDSNAEVVRTASIIIFPWPIFLPIFVVFFGFAFLIFLARKRLARTFRVLIKGEVT